MHRKETSVVFYQDYNRDVFTTLDTPEINLFYELLEVASQQFSGTYTKEFHIELNKLPWNHEKLLRKLRSTIMVVNYHKGLEIPEREDINLLRRTKFTKDKLYFTLEREILKPYMTHRKEFDHVFVKIDWAMKSKYSKFLYRILSEHVGITYEIHYEVLLMLLNLSDPKYLAGRAWPVFNRDVLKKCVEEVTEWSDIKVEYYPIKNKKDKKIIEKVAFEVHAQTPKEHKRELSDREEMDILVSQRIEQKAIKAYEEATIRKRIVDKSAYINSIIQKFDRADIEAEIRLEKWIDYAKEEFKPDSNQPMMLCFDPHHKKEIYVIDNDYGIVDFINKKQITKKPSVTLKRLNLWLEKDADIEFKTLGKIYDEYLVSYINLLPY
jgi:hypothetical protein